MSNSIKIVELSGYSFSGKSAVYDLLCEFEGYGNHGKEFEFDLIRTSNGILNLYNNLVLSWSPVRSSEAIRAFNDLIISYGGDGSLISRLTKSGRHYDKLSPNFTKVSNDYIDQLILATWKSEWPFLSKVDGVLTVILKKVLFRLGYKKIFENTVYLSKFEEREFVDITKSYLNTLLVNSVSTGDKAVVLNNAFEPFTPSMSHRFFDNVKSIVVDRDPRDTYLSALNHGVVNGVDVGNTITGGSVKTFVQRFKIYRNNIENTPKTLRINFESLVLDYEATLDIIYTHLEENCSVHTMKGAVFNPVSSSNNIGMWKTSKNQEDIEYIVKHLEEFCIN